MIEDRDDLLAHYYQMRAMLHEAIDAARGDRRADRTQMSEPTIDGWSVKDHLLHFALWDDVRASEVTRISAGHDSACRMSDEQDAAYNDLGYALRVDLSVAQALWEVETSRQRLLDAIAAATPRGLDGSLYGESALRSAHKQEHAAWIRRWRAERGY